MPVRSSLLEALTKRSWPVFRLRTLLIVVAILALGLGAEAERRRREERAWLLQREANIKNIAEGRKRLAAEHRKRHDKLVQDAERNRLQIERFERPPDFGGDYGRGGSRIAIHFLRLKSELPMLRRLAEWERIMAENANWAADHPREPWPPAPPYPTPPPGTASFPLAAPRPWLAGPSSRES